MDNAQLINQSSGNVEWYTPAHIVEAARQVMGEIDLDPASCARANATVKANRYYTIADNALTVPWIGATAWLNHPFGDKENACKANCTKKRCPARGHCITEDIPGNAAWINKLVAEYKAGNFGEACGICFASTSEEWFQPLYDFSICFVRKRVNYIGPDGLPVKGVTKGSVVYYLGPNAYTFARVFNQLGRVMRPFSV